ncbi:LAGLIDADG family homing endonuclease [Magnetospira sp. QH-2]|uniref:LAGLIDADG family homing endonuclease n=1 Tax=Magnetospira sp. (strain QH-2) TaxID=1288970 RepID=UPI0003E812CD|nr:LAGLIDADG family homing endonuclease [Magnetospira sp. QH-2]CCQ74747.1 putative ribonucleoside-diphosphate reductase [Magnetospira sp. QH-2]
MTTDPTIAPISRQIWDMKYRLKDGEGQPVDKTIGDSWARIARAVASVEEEPDLWEARFLEILEDFKFLPAGRIVAGAGSARQVTLFNCFVMGTIPDDMSGIFESLREAALTMQQGGGIGYDFSSLRPKGALVKGVGADASGPLSFMDVWDAMCRTIMSAGSRRGAMMATLRCDHPDIEAFIEAKREAGRLRMFNLSVLVTDAFMAAVRDKADWDLKFNDRVYKTLPAAELWDKIMRATYDYAEPGVIFIDRINRLNNLSYCESIQATNPCVTGDTWVHTDQGPRQVSELIGRPFKALIDGSPHASGPEGFFPTGRKKTLSLQTSQGYRLRLTPDHLVRRVTKLTRWRRDVEWTKAGDLAPGDRVLLHDHGDCLEWPGQRSEEEGYLIGLLIGDGTLKSDKAVLSCWPGAMACNGSHERPGVLEVMTRAEAAARTLPHRSDFKGWVAVPGRGEYRLATGSLKKMARDLGMAPGHKGITPEIERESSAFQVGLLRGLFDADGSVQGAQQKGVSLRLAQSDLNTLEAAQRMLLRLGIVSTLYRNRRPAESRPLPDGKGGQALYACKACHELVIAKSNMLRYRDRIGFGDTDKSRRLDQALSGYKRALNKESFIVDVQSVDASPTVDVFDVQVPGINAFDGNGLYIHNCGEQPLPPYGACLLGSINLARFVTDPFEDAATLDLEGLERTVRTAVRFLDNVIDLSGFPLDQQLEEAKTKRRIGLGVTGLADALILCRARYGGKRAVELVGSWMATIERTAYLASSEISWEKGSFPLFDAEAYLNGGTVKHLDAEVRQAIADKGIRNALLTSIAPTGTISLFADNVSSGLEPVFSFSYSRNVLMPDGTRREEEVSDHAYRLYRRLKGDGPLPDYFVDSQALSPSEHLVMQSAVQKHVDSSISKTINVPEDMDFDDFKDVYRQAYDLGCKGCTTYRPNDVTGAVLLAKPTKKEITKVQDNDQPELPFERPAARVRTKADSGDQGAKVHQMFKPLDRPEALPGATYKLRWPESDHAIYVTLNDLIDDTGRRRPFEVFINSKDTEHYAWTVGLTRMISAVFRRGGDVSFVVEELKNVFDPRGGHWMGGRYIPSLLAAMGEVIEQHMIAIGFITQTDGLSPDDQAKPEVVMLTGTGDPRASTTDRPVDHGDAAPKIRARHCPKCQQPSLIKQEGCDTCTSCGYSKCG